MSILKSCTSCLAIGAAVAMLAIAVPTVGQAQTPTTWQGGCTTLWQPVCAVWKDHKKHMYANDCWAKKDGATHIKAGACKK